MNNNSAATKKNILYKERKINLRNQQTVIKKSYNKNLLKQKIKV